MPSSNTFRTEKLNRVLSVISTLELRHIIESAFLPLKCKCTALDVDSLTIQLINPDSLAVELCVTGVSVKDLQSSRSIAALITELRQEHRLICIAGSQTLVS